MVPGQVPLAQVPQVYPNAEHVVGVHGSSLSLQPARTSKAKPVMTAVRASVFNLVSVSGQRSDSARHRGTRLSISDRDKAMAICFPSQVFCRASWDRIGCKKKEVNVPERRVCSHDTGIWMVRTFRIRTRWFDHVTYGCIVHLRKRMHTRLTRLALLQFFQHPPGCVVRATRMGAGHGPA
jgi:hypothetical protein